VLLSLDVQGNLPQCSVKALREIRDGFGVSLKNNRCAVGSVLADQRYTGLR
jgi:hypothetical protein